MSERTIIRTVKVAMTMAPPNRLDVQDDGSVIIWNSPEHRKIMQVKMHKGLPKKALVKDI